jgi:hypothetical protein
MRIKEQRQNPSEAVVVPLSMIRSHSGNTFGFHAPRQQQRHQQQNNKPIVADLKSIGSQEAVVADSKPKDNDQAADRDNQASRQVVDIDSCRRQDGKSRAIVTAGSAESVRVTGETYC